MDFGALFATMAEALNRRDWDRAAEFLAPDVVLEYPQSGEQFRGIANLVAMQRNYPGGLPESGVDAESLRLAADEQRWALTPLLTVLPVEGSGDKATAAFRVRYPDASTWWAILFVEAIDGKVSHIATFFAPLRLQSGVRPIARTPRSGVASGEVARRTRGKIVNERQPRSRTSPRFPHLGRRPVL